MEVEGMTLSSASADAAATFNLGDPAGWPMSVGEGATTEINTYSGGDMGVSIKYEDAGANDEGTKHLRSVLVLVLVVK